MRPLPLLLVVLLLGSSCKKDPTEVYFSDERNYYDLPTCVIQQKDFLQKTGKHVRKKLTKDGHTQVIERGDVDWDEEFEMFIDSDINRPAWRGSFLGDTVQLERMKVITYRAQNPEIPVRNVVVTLDRATGQCLKLTIDRRTDNFLYSSNQKLFLTPGEGYTIKGQLRVPWLFESEFTVESTFIDG